MFPRRWPPAVRLAALLATVTALCAAVLVSTSHMWRGAADGMQVVAGPAAPGEPQCPAAWDASNGSIAFLHIPKTSGTFLTRQAPPAHSPAYAATGVAGL